MSHSMSHFIQMTHKTALDGQGIFQLGIIQDFFKSMKIPLSRIGLNGELFNLDPSSNRSFWTDFDRKGFKLKTSSAST